ncbi:MAG: tungsten formylmethanofuran dehydrogenase [Candidatus Nealsonbacteria bacterium]|nr:MAG: tungsten formylmethanofuran dehydrogenase [Candidatus Nealsonbacteria bacterium]
MFKVIIDAQRCKGCGFCVKFCPKNLIQLDSEFNDKGYHPAVFTDEEKCIGCAICGLVCPDVAITVYKMEEKSD